MIGDLKKFHQLSIHESILVEADARGEVCVMRVMGGWIYNRYERLPNKGLDLKTSTFVPDTTMHAKAGA